MRKPPEFLYHGTTSQCLEGILENGLVLNKGRVWGIPFKPVVFFTSSVKKAGFYAFLRQRMSGFAPEGFRQKAFHRAKGEPVVLRVQTSGLDLDAIRPDFWWKFLGELGQWRYHKGVPPDAIKIEESPVSGMGCAIAFSAYISLLAIGVVASLLIGLGVI